MSPYPLEGLRVLDLSRVVAGPFAGRMLADLGADVVKVEPPTGDITRVWGEVRHGLSGFYTQQNAGKRNICIDLNAPGGADLVRDLARAADVLIENFRPGVLERRGLAWEHLHQVNRRLVMLSVTGFGQEGPEASRRSYAPVIHAEAGLLARQAQLTGEAPIDMLISIADYNAAMHGLAAILAALLLRERTGEGQHIDIALFDALLTTDEYTHHIADGSELVRLGGEVWDAQGGAVLIAGDFRFVWRQANTVLGVADPGGATVPEKVAARRGAFGEWIKSFDDRDALHAALDAARLPWGDVNDPHDVPSLAHVVHRGLLADVDDRGGGTRRVVQSPYHFSDASSGIRGGAPRRGEHNREVLAEWAAIGDDRYEDLAKDGVLQAESLVAPPAGTK